MTAQVKTLAWNVPLSHWQLRAWGERYQATVREWNRLGRHQQHRVRQAEALDLGYLDLGGEGGY